MTDLNNWIFSCLLKAKTDAAESKSVKRTFHKVGAITLDTVKTFQFLVKHMWWPVNELPLCIEVLH